MENKIKELNQAAWDKYVKNQNQWTIPVSTEDITRARKGQFEIKLTPWKPVPRNWLCNLKQADVLCLASGGGQQAPILSAAGARVVVLDIVLIQGDMTDLSTFAKESFDLIFHPFANCFISDIYPVWKESFRCH